MPNIIYHFAAISKLTLEYEKGAPASAVKSVDTRLEVSGNLERSEYVDSRGLLKKDGLKPMTQALVMGLISNMRMGAKKGWWKEHEHMQYVIDELQRAFVAQSGDPEYGVMEY